MGLGGRERPHPHRIATVDARAPRHVGCHAIHVNEPAADLGMEMAERSMDIGPHDRYSGHPCEECAWKLEKLLSLGYDALVVDMV